MTTWKPSVTVAAVVERDGRFLLVEESIDGRLVLNQPAGHLDPHESLVDACRREVLEETAHHFEPQALVGVYRWHFAKKDKTFIRFLFSGRVAGVEPGRPLDKGIVAAPWLTAAQIDARKNEHRSPLVAQCMADYLAGKRYPLDIFSREFP
jgi:ADP-ribose pyrophosphatase YjhB (NUDIX family)